MHSDLIHTNTPNTMAIKPGFEEALRRLRIDNDLADDVPAAIEQAHAETEAYLDRRLYADAGALDLAADLRGMVATPDIIAAQLLLIDVLIGNNSDKERESKHAAALNMLRRHRFMGA